jgi:hypothetical protein
LRERKASAPLHVVAQADTEDAAQKLIERPAAANAGVVVDDLLGPIVGNGFYRLRDAHHIGDLVGIGHCVPGAVVADYKSLHGGLPNRQRASPTIPGKE